MPGSAAFDQRGVAAQPGILDGDGRACDNGAQAVTDVGPKPLATGSSSSSISATNSAASPARAADF